MAVATRSVVIHREQLMKISEPFIYDQGASLRRYSPVFTGRTYALPADMRPDLNTITAGKYLAQASHVLFGSLNRLRSIDQVEPPPALVHAHFAIDAVYAVPLAKRLNIPLIVTLHGFDVMLTWQEMLKAGEPSWVRYLAMRQRLFERCARFLCVSTHVLDAAVEAGFPRHKLEVHHIGIDAERVSGLATERPASDTRRRAVVVTVGRLVAFKGTCDLVRAVGKLGDAGWDIELVIIGDGPERASIELEIARLRLMDRVELTGPLGHAEVLNRVSRASIFALPSKTSGVRRKEGLGMVLLEAAALGVPIVATASGGITDFIIDGETGLLVPEGAPDLMARAIALLLQDERLVRDLTRKARARVDDQFSLHKQTAKLEAIYDDIVCGATL